MNSFQETWWRQSKSDHDVFLLLRSEGVAQCHVLHQLQMATEKIAKAYFWRSSSPPPRSHSGFVQFLRFLGQTRQGDRERIANIFTFRRFVDFQHRIRQMQPIAYELERLAPALACDGPNPEYPWPHAQPKFVPATYVFPIWASIGNGNGRDLMRIIQIAVNRFPEYSDV